MRCAGRRAKPGERRVQELQVGQMHDGLASLLPVAGVEAGADKFCTRSRIENVKSRNYRKL
jgi:hypothetical protein